MNLKKLPKTNYKQKIIYLSAVFIALSGIIIYFVLLPAINDIKKLRAEIINQKVDLEKKLSQEKNMTKLSDKIKKIEPQIDILENIYINKNRQLEFITVLEGIADKQQVAQKIVLNPENETKELNYYKTPLSIVVQGTYNNLINYLINLENINYYINIYSLSLNSSGQSGRTSHPPGGEAEQNLVLRISAYTYWK